MALSLCPPLPWESPPSTGHTQRPVKSALSSNSVYRQAVCSLVFELGLDCPGRLVLTGLLHYKAFSSGLKLLDGCVTEVFHLSSWLAADVYNS